MPAPTSDPPVAARLAISAQPLSLDRVYALASAPSNGAIALMSGTVRNQTEGAAVTALEYQAHEPMAVSVFGQIEAEARQQWPALSQLVIHHRVGYLTVGETSVLVAAGAPHRGDAFAACRYAIDALKHRAPIWKKEYWADGSSDWVGMGACERSDSHGGDAVGRS